MKKSAFVILFMLLIMLVDGCNSNKYFSSKDENKIYEDDYEKFDNNMSEVFAWEEDGKISADYGFKKGIQDGTDIILEGHGIVIWGTSTLAEFELKNETELEISREEKDKSGLFKLLICDENRVIETIGKNENRKVTLQDGIYKVKIIGAPAHLSSLCIRLSGIENSEVTVTNQN